MSQGGVTHIELRATDLAASQRVYARILGWRVERIPGWSPRAMFTTPGGQEGEVDNLDASLGKSERMDGHALVRETSISDEFELFALFRDDVSNRLDVWSRTQGERLD
jgi:predicted enzyme related to lactoylglutathione lyase